MSSHPGSDLEAAIELAEQIRDIGYMPEQVQDFYPTPSTISTVMYYTGVDPRNMKPVYVTVNPHEKAMQLALIQYRNPDNYDLVKETLLKAGRTDLIGFEQKCLIKPRNINKKNEKDTKSAGGGKSSHQKNTKLSGTGKGGKGKNTKLSGTGKSGNEKNAKMTVRENGMNEKKTGRNVKNNKKR